MVIWICHWIKVATSCKTPGHVFQVCFCPAQLVCAQKFIWICMFVQATISVVSIYCLSLCRSVCLCVFCVHETLLKTSQRSLAESLLWKWIVGILYLSMPPFGPWNAQAYFPIMALSCSQLPWEPRRSPRSALLTPSFAEVWRGRWGGKKGASVLYSAMMSERWWGTVIMHSLLFSLCTGGIVSSGRSYSLKLWNMTQPMVCVHVRVFAQRPSQQIYSGAFVETRTHIHF